MKGKAKEDFEKWYYNKFNTTEEESLKWFNTFDFSLQSGVLLEFFDSVGIYIDIGQTPTRIGKFEYFIWFDDIRNRVREHKAQFKTREQALKEAFNKTEEIYNQNKQR